MMQAFRNAAKPVIVVVTLAFMLWLVWDLSGLSSGGSSLLSRTSVGKINGRAIDLRTFDQRVQNVVSDEQRRSSTNLGLDEISQIRDRVWEQVIQEVLLAQEYRRLGLTVSADEVAEAIRSIPLPEVRQLPELQTNGQFDPEKYQRWLASSVGQSVIPALEMQYREQLQQAKLFRSVVGDVFISDAALWERFRDEREQVQIGLARIDPEVNVNDEAAPVSADEARAYYSAHRDEFDRERQAFVSYIRIPRVAIASDSAASRERIQSLRDEILAGAPFAEIAQRESADTVSGAQGGDLGEMGFGQVVPEFAEPARTLPLNTVSEPVLTQFGYHLIQVDSRTGETFKARHLLIPIEIIGDHRDQLDALADSLETLAAEKLDRAALDTAARALNQTIRVAGPITPGTRVFVPEGAVPDAGVWAFQAETAEHSPVIEAPNAFYVFRLDSLRPAGVPPYEAIQAAVEARTRLAKKVTKAKELAQQLAEQARSTDLANVAKTLGFEYREVGPFARLSGPLPSPALIGASFGLAPQAVSLPIQGSAGPSGADDGVYVIQSLQRTPADSADFVANLGAIRQQALQAARQSRVQAYVGSLRQAARITDNRAQIYRTAAQNAQLAGPTAL